MSKRQYVIFDTAPTGHSLLLLDATGAYHSEVLKHLPEKLQGRVATPLSMLQATAKLAFSSQPCKHKNA